MNNNQPILQDNPHGKRIYCEECKGYVKFKFGVTGRKWCRICNLELK